MAGGVEADADTIDIKHFAEVCRLFFAAEILAVADAHDVERLAGGENLAMAGTGMIGMAVGDQRPLDGAHRIDMEIAGRAIEPGSVG